MTPKQEDDLAHKVIGCIIAGVVVIMLLATVTFPAIDKKNAERELWLTQHKCKVTGYYGRSGSYKVYTCDNGIYKENDL